MGIFAKRLRIHKNASGELYLDLSKGANPYGVIQITPTELPLLLSIGWKEAHESEFNAQDEKILEIMERQAQEDLHTPGQQTIDRLALFERIIADLNK